NQFHDILPGTCYTGVTQKAVAENLAVIEEANALSYKTAATLTDGEGVTYFNTTSFDRNDVIETTDNGVYPVGTIVQRYTDLKGEKKVLIGGVAIDAMSAVSYPTASTFDEGVSPFAYKAKTVETPFAKVVFDENGSIASFFDKEAERELRREGAEPLNTFYTGEDVPNSWDNWDIDYETMLKVLPQKELLSFEVVSDGALAFIIRASFKVGTYSTLTQDIIFYADSPKVDFHTVIDWNDKHTLLKTGFDVDINSLTVKNEIQFGHMERPTTENNNYEIAKFEICNHKWSDLSESRYGVAILNDCKYGMDCAGSNMRLTLHRGGTHPDVTADKGVHELTYSFLPHNAPFSVNSVVKPAYLLNMPTVSVNGCLKNDFTPILGIDADNVIVEAIKPAELVKSAYVARIYEAERTRTNARIYVGSDVKKAYRTNILEDVKYELPIVDGSICYSFKPFEVATFMLIK
ncbi:MAG: alpha-mannosidase, partial [Clostridia bacterium]|nr:alpha-mannosidase [Clostridia bacterium]